MFRSIDTTFPTELFWLAKQIRPLLYWHAASFLCITAGSLLALLTPLILKWLIDGIFPQKRVGLVALAAALIFLGHQAGSCSPPSVVT